MATLECLVIFTNLLQFQTMFMTCLLLSDFLAGDMPPSRVTPWPWPAGHVLSTLRHTSLPLNYECFYLSHFITALTIHNFTHFIVLTIGLLSYKQTWPSTGCSFKSVSRKLKLSPDLSSQPLNTLTPWQLVHLKSIFFVYFDSWLWLCKALVRKMGGCYKGGATPWRVFY